MREPDTASDSTKPRDLLRFVVRLEEIFFTFLLAVLVIAGLLPIFSRFFDISGLTWTGTLSQELVLWIALFGAGAATRDRKHISIDAVAHFLPARGRLAVRALGELFAGVVCFWLFVPAFLSVFSEEGAFVGEGTAFLGIPERWLPAVIPLGLALLTLRFFLAAGVDLVGALGHSSEKEEEEEAP